MSCVKRVVLSARIHESSRVTEDVARLRDVKCARPSRVERRNLYNGGLSRCGEFFGFAAVSSPSADHTETKKWNKNAACGSVKGLSYKNVTLYVASSRCKRERTETGYHYEERRFPRIFQGYAAKKIFLQNTEKKKSS